MFTTGFGEISKQASVASEESALAVSRRARRIAAAGVLALASSLIAAPAAQAQNCPTTDVPHLGAIGSSISSVGAMIGSTITATSTAFLLQSSSFIGIPPNPAPDQQGGGIWVRGVGGEVSVKSSSVSSAVTTAVPSGAVLGGGTITCSQKVNDNFAGVQFGADVARLNINGWNLHLGTTAGVLSSRANLVGGAFAFADPANGGLPAGGGSFTSSTQVPFAGVYGAATNGGFFIDGLLRAEYYQSSLTSIGNNLFGQAIDAHGWTFSSSAGYNWTVPNSTWFIEPSAAVMISRTKVDPLAFTTGGLVGPVIDSQIPSTLQMNDIKSDIGRVGLRVGETIDGGNVVWQPFAAVSVWHEFGPQMSVNYAEEPGIGGSNTTGTGSITTVGTFGQYSLGISGAVVGTGWLGFARVDYRDGPQLQGLSASGGLRYQFTPEAAPHNVMAVKAPVYKAPVVQAVNWTGWYIGAFGGAALGRADWGYIPNEVSPHVGGFEGGGAIGYKWQRDQWVFGVEANIEGLNAKGGTACNPGVTVTPTPAPVQLVGPMLLTTCNANVSWIATATARLGYTWERVLFYVKGGGAWTDERFSASCNNVSAAAAVFSPCTNPVGAATTGFSANNNRGGWTVGYGTEFALTRNWSAVAETDFTSFGDTNITASDGSALRVGMRLWETKIGVNYRFASGL
jgi:opacity protein-like surface antigen